MQCTEFYNYAERWLEGERTPQARAHVEACGRCRAFVAEMEAIAAVAREIEDTTPEPPERVWIALRNQLETEGLIRGAEVEGGWLPRNWSEVFGGFGEILRRPALAGAYAAVAVLAILLLNFPSADVQHNELGAVLYQPAPDLGPGIQAARFEVASALREKNPTLAATYRQNLEIVDKFIVLCEKTVRENPDNHIVVGHLYAAYQQKAELLATMVERGVGD